MSRARRGTKAVAGLRALPRRRRARRLAMLLRRWQEALRLELATARRFWRQRASQRMPWFWLRPRRTGSATETGLEN